MTPSYSEANYAVLAPSIVLVVGALGCLLLETTRPALRRLVNGLAIVTCFASAAILYLVGQQDLVAGDALALEVRTDLLVLGFAPAFYLGAIGALLLAGPYLRANGKQRGEFQALVLFSLTGMVLLAQARDLLVLFLALETLSIPLYVLAGFFTDRERSIESALKYFTVGAFSSAFVAFGMALAYGASGSLRFDEIRAALAGGGPAGQQVLAQAALAFLVVGFAFKIAVAPFHAWAPDVYQGAPTPVTALLAVGSKAAGFAGLLRILLDAFPALPGWQTALSLIAALTLVVGNTVAMLQEDIKRLLAYSGIAHAGFLLMAVVAHQDAPGASLGIARGPLDPALQAVLFYFAAYSLMTMGALAVVAVLEREYGRSTLVVDHAGLGTRRPALAAAMLVFMLSLGGMPPLAGFMAKWLILQRAVAAGLGWLVVVAAVTSVVAFYYYLRVVLQMYLRPARGSADAVPVGAGGRLLIGGAVVATVALGVLPWLVLDPLAGVPAIASGP